ncbi:hypothetical protein HY642_05150 [Candidatus Woesearchaeota archaeon]|nr:hypothetical protein [Candidatus Woesearchaeota archaeon]
MNVYTNMKLGLAAVTLSLCGYGASISYNKLSAAESALRSHPAYVRAEIIEHAAVNVRAAEQSLDYTPPRTRTVHSSVFCRETICMNPLHSKSVTDPARFPRCGDARMSIGNAIQTLGDGDSIGSTLQAIRASLPDCDGADSYHGNQVDEVTFKPQQVSLEAAAQTLDTVQAEYSSRVPEDLRTATRTHGAAFACQVIGAVLAMGYGIFAYKRREH